MAGKYDANDETAVVNGNGYSIAMGTGSFENALARANLVTEDWRYTPEGRSFLAEYHKTGGTQILAWARPHTGAANSHTRIDYKL